MTERRAFEVTVSEHDTATVVQVEGELDLGTVNQLETALEGVDAGSRLVIDLTACTFLDSAGVRALLMSARSTEEAGGELSVVASDPGILRVLEITAVDSVLRVHPQLDATL